MTKKALLTGFSVVILATMSAGAQQPAPPENGAVPEMPKQTTRTGKRVNRVIDLLKEGVMICTGGDTPAADKGRAFTKRIDPW
jgi:hypothetical protein